jgi:hypothetical protein
MNPGGAEHIRRGGGYFDRRDEPQTSARKAEVMKSCTQGAGCLTSASVEAIAALDQPMTNSESGGIATVVDTELGEDADGVCLDRAGADKERLGDLIVGPALR